MSTTNTMKMDAELSWFFMHFTNDKDGKETNSLVDPWQVLEQRFPTAERRSLRELSEELRATGRWIRKDIPSDYWQGGY
jgi:hypothetical protein